MALPNPRFLPLLTMPLNAISRLWNPAARWVIAIVLLGAGAVHAVEVAPSWGKTSYPETGSSEIDELFPPPESPPDENRSELVPFGESPADRCKRLLTLLSPEAGKYASIQLLDELSRWSGSNDDTFTLDQVRSINRAFLGYLDFHRKSLERTTDTRALRSHLEQVTRVCHAHWFLSTALEEYPELAKEFETTPPTSGFIPRQFWRNESRDDSPAWQEQYGDRCVDGDSLYSIATDKQSSEPHIVELNLATGATRRQKVSASKNVVTQPLVHSGRLFLRLDGVSYKKWDEPAWHTAAIGLNELYGTLTPWESGLLFAWSAPPHYFGALEREPELAKKPDFLASLQSSLHVLTPGEKSFQQAPASPSLAFLNSTDQRIADAFAIEPGRLVVVMEERYERPWESPPRKQIHVSLADSVSEFKHLASVPSSWTVRAWPGRPQHLLVIVSRPGTEFLHSLDEPQPEQVLSYDLESGRLTRLWKMDSSQIFIRPWERDIPKEPGEAQWKLPADLNPPVPGTAFEWISTFGRGEDVFAFCSRTKVGAQVSPDYELLVFKAGQAATKRVPLHFVLPEEVKKDLIRAAAIRQNPSREDDLKPMPMPGENYLAFDTHYGVFWVSWKEIEAWMGK
ncbi:MAG: hypothetical protein ACAI34_09355 [Verrucomicrobium sp.]